MSKVFDFLRNDSPYGSVRVAMIVSIFLFIPSFVVTWTYLSWRLMALQVIPESVMFFLMVLLGFKTAEKGIEMLQGIFGKKDVPKPEA